MPTAYRRVTEPENLRGAERDPVTGRRATARSDKDRSLPGRAPRSRRALVAVGAVVAVLLVAGGAVALVSGGGDSEGESADDKTQPTARSSGSPGTSGGTSTPRGSANQGGTDRSYVGALDTAVTSANSQEAGVTMDLACEGTTCTLSRSDGGKLGDFRLAGTALELIPHDPERKCVPTSSVPGTISWPGSGTGRVDDAQLEVTLVFDAPPITCDGMTFRPETGTQSFTGRIVP